MEKEKTLGFDKNSPQSGAEGGGDGNGGGAPRARNRTVMLTPEMTGQVRARLAQDMPSTQPTLGIPAPANPPAASDGFIPLAPRTAGRPSVSETPGRPLTPLETARTTEVSRPSEEVPARLRGGVPIAGTPIMSSSNPVVPAADATKGSVVYAKKTKIVGFLVSYDSNELGDIFEMRVGRVIVTSEVSGTGNFFVVHDSTVSPMHAILRVSAGGEVQVLDQLSEHGTKIHRFGSNEEIELSGEKGNVEHGDIVRFGKRSFHVCMIQGLES